MKLQGDRRTSPASSAEITATHNCPQCSFIATRKNVVDSHVQENHGMLPTCPFCQVGFNNLGALKKHIENYHRENQEQDVRPSFISQNKPYNSNVRQQLCIFHLHPQGCKKGQNCGFSHDSNSQQNKIFKVRKACYNGTNCSWKPRCRYVHVEDGEVMPARVPREVGRRFQDRPYPAPTSNQDFVIPDMSQQPPGFSQNLSSLAQFPRLPQPTRPGVFRMNPQCHSQ